MSRAAMVAERERRVRRVPDLRHGVRLMPERTVKLGAVELTMREFRSHEE